MKNIKLKILLVVILTTIFYGIYSKPETKKDEGFAQILMIENGKTECIKGYCPETKKQITNKISSEEFRKNHLKKLGNLESNFGKKRKVLDTNNKYSLGLFHFQATTVQDMYKRYYAKNISITEAIKIAENDTLATKLAHDANFVFKETWHWKISNCKLGLITENCLTQKQINNLYLAKK